MGNRCLRMKTRTIIDEAATSFGPEPLKVIGQAFDEAWASIAPQFYSNIVIASARLRLATIILAIASEDSRDVEALKRDALERMEGGRWRGGGMMGTPESWQGGIEP
jgi:hypothetical protein